ncbi:WXG100 protein secretion system (Wss), protein YukD [Clostridium acidisoli DSM 12555]|uniref:WXG100 protein secretion system (Wss), protein YukD n=1 Tax=Clostridium acidisoli DSM 12555 TaxID=1121291 RepID=A0A1W1XZP7_9CLOT|nr:EsaB/YukD family protein [Clostridium acidisoli]SMC29011.1 WXG100 protein secretion system (Wss), protein YukD [Clostridium acidisoli DSM 12555]
MEKAIVTVGVDGTSIERDLEIPIDISVKEICAVLSKALNLEENKINITGYYLKAENPICFLKGNDILKKFNVSDGTKISLV